MEQRAAPRAPAIDLGRIVAAAAVMAYHGLYLMPLTGQVPWRTGTVVASVASYGYLGVEFFFMVSGYVIAMSVDGRTRFQFARDRFARLAPAFVMCICLTTLVRWGDVSLAAIIANFTLFPGALGLPYVDGVYWSLAVEVLFYATVCVVLFGAPYFRQRMRWVLVVGLMLCFVPVSYVQWVPYFGVGVATFLWQGKRRERDGWLLAVFVALAAWRAWAQAHLVGATLPIQPEPAMVAALVAVMGAAMPVLAGVRLSARGCRIAMTLGAISYPLYLLHNEFARPFFNAAWGHPLAVGGVLVTLLVLCHVVARLEAPARRKIRALEWYSIRLPSALRPR